MYIHEHEHVYTYLSQVSANVISSDEGSSTGWSYIPSQDTECSGLSSTCTPNGWLS